MKYVSTYSLFCASLLLAFVVSAQPPGDVCETALPLIVPGTVEGSTCEMAIDYPIECPFYGNGPDVFYRYTPEIDEVVNLTLCGGITDFDTKLAVYDTCISGSFFSCNDDGCAAPNYPSPYVSHINGVALTAGATYYVEIAGYGGDCGNFTLDVSLALPGDVCANALPLSVPDTVSGSTSDFNNNHNYYCDAGTETGADVVYAYTPAADDTVTFNLCTGGTDFSTCLYIYAGSCEPNSVIACNRRGCEIYYNLGWRSLLQCVPMSAGTTYFVVIDGGSATEQGNYTLTVDRCPPPGDVCETAIPIAIPDTVSGNNCFYSDQYDAICPYTWNVFSYDVVYAYAPETNLRASFSLCTGTTNYDTKLFIFRDTCQSYDPIACNDDACEAPNFNYPFVSRLSDVPLFAGSTYYIVVDAYYENLCGDYTLVTSFAPPDPPQHLTVYREPDLSPHVMLRWNASFGANLYYVYRDTTTFVEPTPEHLLGMTTDITYTDSHAVDQSAASYFYVVTAGME